MQLSMALWEWGKIQLAQVDWEVSGGGGRGGGIFVAEFCTEFRIGFWLYVAPSGARLQLLLRSYRVLAVYDGGDGTGDTKKKMK